MLESNKIAEIIKYQDLEIQKIKINKQFLSNDEKEKINNYKEFVKSKQKEALSKEPEAEKINSEIEKGIFTLKKGLEIADKYLSKNIENLSYEELVELEKKCQKTLGNFDTVDGFINGNIKKGNKIIKEYSEHVNNIKKGKKAIKSIEEEIEKKKVEVKPQLDAIDKELALLDKKIDATLMKKYKEKKESKVFPVFVYLTSKNSCGGCGVQLSLSSISKIDNNGLLECEQCKKVIVKQ